MLIDWFTVTAQIGNFLILVFLLKKFLYGPIVEAMDARERRIAATLREADEQRRQADEQARQMIQQRQELAAAQEEMLAAARREVESWREDALRKARDGVKAQQHAWQDGLANGMADFADRFRERTARLVVRTADKVLTDLAADQLEERVLFSFLDEVRNASKDQEEHEDQESAILVTTGFPISEEAKERVTLGLREIYGDSPLEFVEDREIGFGIRLKSGDRKLEWNLARYMADMEEEVLQMIGRAARRENND